MTSYAKIGRRLKIARNKIGLTQTEVAEKAGIYPNYYAKIERGEVNTSIEKLYKIIKALKAKSADILPF